MAWLQRFSDKADPDKGGMKAAVIATVVTLVMTAIAFIAAAIMHVA